MPIRHLPALLLLLAAPTHGAPTQDGAETGGRLAQLRFDGALTAADRVEVEVGALVEGTPRRLDVHVFLGAGTTGADVAALVASRLESSEFHAHIGAPSEGSRARSLFVEKALFVHVRVGSGVSAEVTVCEGPPTSLRVLSSPRGSADLDLVLSVGTYHPASEEHETAQVSLTLEAGAHEARCSERIHAATSAAKWASDRPKTELWRPLRMIDGGRITGLSVGVAHGWRVEVDLREE